MSKVDISGIDTYITKLEVAKISVAVHRVMEPILGIDSLNDLAERYRRFIEESLELGQAGGMSREEHHFLVDYVHDRAIGEPRQEVAGVLMTLLTLAHTLDIDPHQALVDELRRVQTKVDEIRMKQAQKPVYKGSADIL